MDTISYVWIPCVRERGKPDFTFKPVEGNTYFPSRKDCIRFIRIQSYMISVVKGYSPIAEAVRKGKVVQPVRFNNKIWRHTK